MPCWQFRWNLTQKRSLLPLMKLTNYSSDEISKIKGQKTENIRAILGASAYDEVIHRDNMAVTTRRDA